MSKHKMLEFVFGKYEPCSSWEDVIFRFYFKTRRFEKKWNKLVASKHIYHEELRVTMDQQIDQAKVLFQQRMLTEQMFYTRHANILQTGWTVKKYSKNKNFLKFRQHLLTFRMIP